MKCLVCEDTGWVCENHPDQPFRHPAPCDICDIATVCSGPPEGRQGYAFGNIFES
jgi:hypothetical protein